MGIDGFELAPRPLSIGSLLFTCAVRADLGRDGARAKRAQAVLDGTIDLLRSAKHPAWEQPDPGLAQKDARRAW